SHQPSAASDHADRLMTSRLWPITLCPISLWPVTLWPDRADRDEGRDSGCGGTLSPRNRTATLLRCRGRGGNRHGRGVGNPKPIAGPDEVAGPPPRPAPRGWFTPIPHPS